LQCHAARHRVKDDLGIERTRVAIETGVGLPAWNRDAAKGGNGRKST
jgi:hypothetical protein